MRTATAPSLAMLRASRSAPMFRSHDNLYGTKKSGIPQVSISIPVSWIRKHHPTPSRDRPPCQEALLIPLRTLCASRFDGHTSKEPVQDRLSILNALGVYENLRRTGIRPARDDLSRIKTAASPALSHIHYGQPAVAGAVQVVVRGLRSRPRQNSRHYSPLEGESASQGRQPAGAPVGGNQTSLLPSNPAKSPIPPPNPNRRRGLLWHFLRNKQLDGYKFRRQQPIGPYIADFACLSRKLLIELAGSQHAERYSYDEKRDNLLQEKGYRVLRFWNDEVLENCFGVLERVYEALTSPPPHQPSPVGSASACLSCGRRQATPPRGGSDWTVERARAYLSGMDDSIVDLFPDRLVDSALGPIPEGWEVKALGDLCYRPQYGYTASAIDGPAEPKFLRITEHQQTVVD